MNNSSEIADILRDTTLYTKKGVCPTRGPTSKPRSFLVLSPPFLLTIYTLPIPSEVKN